MSMIDGAIPQLKNGDAVPLVDVPLYDFTDFREEVTTRVNSTTRLAAFFGQPRPAGGIRLWAVLANHQEEVLSPLATDLQSDSFQSLTPDCPQAHNFEREIAEQYGVVPTGHPWFKPLRYHHSYRPGHDAWGRAVGDKIIPCDTAYHQLTGAEVHEVAVGPVHAGVIEPGSFRFQCHGEHVFYLEIQLGYQHRGVERALLGGPNKRTLHYMETLAGDTTIGHTTAYCQIIEGLSGSEPSLRAQAIRGIALELERLACHTGDLGALADDVGFLPTSNFCGRLRGDFLNATGTLCGNRFGRNLVKPGGVGFDIDHEMAHEMAGKLTSALYDVDGAARLLWDSMTVQARFEGTGILTRQQADALGVVGLALRATGSECDARQDFSSGIYRYTRIPVASCATGDVQARASMRGQEIWRSGRFVLEHLQDMHRGELLTEVGPLAPDSLAVSLVEGWRGPVCHVAITDSTGHFARYKVVDPSFHNWIGLMMALRNQQISDFPLCNKSFNLSYCGHDL